MNYIQITGAKQGNLKDISLDIPKNKLTVFTGVSGSGKSTLLLDVLFNECQRQYLEAMSMQGIHKPDVARVRGASPAIVIPRTDTNKNPRSTVGTMTDLYTDLRMIYEKLGVRICPHCGEYIPADGCREETQKTGTDFFVYMYCCKCGGKMDKITRTMYSFNTREGACPACEGLGRIHSVRTDAAVDEALSLEDGAVRYWEKQYGAYQISVLYNAYRHYGIEVPANDPVKKFSDLQKEILYYGVECERVKQKFPNISPPKTAAAGRFEGAVPILHRRFAEKNGDTGRLSQFFDVVECPECKGERLCKLSRDVTVKGIRLPQLTLYSLERLYEWADELGASLSEGQLRFMSAYLLDMKTKLARFLRASLGYLTLDRQVTTLSGGELQRLRLAAAMDSELSGIIYILDEPTAGLHPKDTEGLIEILRRLRDLDNTVLVIEHDVDVMAAADYIVDMGPGSGRYGGEIIAAGTLDELKQCKSSVTGKYLQTTQPGKMAFRKAAGVIHIANADLYNLHNISADIPAGCLTSVTGPSGSGKSTLIFKVLAKGNDCTQKGQVSGLSQFNRIVCVEQSAITRMKRSNVATYSEVYAEIRKVFEKTQKAGESGLTAKHFSFNTPGGRCGNCQGLGYIDNNMLFFADTEIVCPVCGGKRFHEDVLAVKYKDLSVSDVLELSADEAAVIFADYPGIVTILTLLQDVGLGYLQLGQSLTTLSGGEGQRLKLAKELIANPSGRRSLYLLDEPTTGLHPEDIEHFLVLLNRMTDAGNTIVVVEHNQQVIRNSDWVIDLGPEGGERGGHIIFEGTPEKLKAYKGSVTGLYL